MHAACTRGAGLTLCPGGGSTRQSHLRRSLAASEHSRARAAVLHRQTILYTRAQRLQCRAQQHLRQEEQQATPASALPSPAAATAGTSESQPPPQQQQQQQQQQDPEFALILIACGIGLAAGASIVLFNDAVHVIRESIWHQDAGGMSAALTFAQQQRLLGNSAAAESEVWPKVVFPPVLGGLFVGGLGWLIGGYDDRPPAPPSSSSGSGGGNGAWRAKLAAVVRPVSRGVAATVTLGTGASLGPEGPSVDIGRSVAKGLGTSLRNRQSHLLSLLAAGSGAGVAAGFNAPIAGVFFAVETVIQKQQQKAAPEAAGGAKPRDASSGLIIAMVLLASVVAAVVSQAGLGSSPAFRVPAYRLESITELPLYLGFGALCGIVSASFSFSMRVASEAFEEVRQQNPVEAALLPGLGGLTTGVLALGYPEILYQGFDNVNLILSSNGDYAPGLLVQIVVMKVIATSICRGSGLQGGLYAPSIFIGAALGSAFGQLAHVVGDPAGLVLSAPQAYALVGVAAMLASNCAVPLTSVLLLFELTRDYLIILPTLAAVGISFWVSQLAAPSVKRAAAARRVSSAAAAGLLVGGRGASAGQTAGSAGHGSSSASSGSSGSDTDGGNGVGAAPRPAAPRSGVAAAGEAVAAAAAAMAGAAAARATGSRDVEGGPLVVLGDTAGPLEGVSLAAGAAAVVTGLSAGAAAQVSAAAAAAGQPVSVTLALEDSCLVVAAETGLEQALQLMEQGDQHVAVVVGADSSVLGVVSREVLQECADAMAAALAAAALPEVAAAGRKKEPAAEAAQAETVLSAAADIIDRA